MITVPKKAAPEWYTPPSEEKSDNPTRFLLKPLSGIEHYEASQHCEARYNDAGELSDVLIPAKAAKIAIRHAIIDVENLAGYDPDTPLVEQLPAPVIRNLASAIFARCVLDTEEKKISVSPSRSAENTNDSIAADAHGENIATPITNGAAAVVRHP